MGKGRIMKMHTNLVEAKKHLSFREAWVGALIALGFLILMLKNMVYPAPDVSEQWNIVFQNIRTYGATLTAFLIVTGLSRLMCYERERKTDELLFTATNGKKIVFFSKTGFAALYCLLSVTLIGTVSLLVHGASFGFADASGPVKYCSYYSVEGLPPMSNLVYGIVQYLFLFLGALCMAGFVLILGVLTQRTALTMSIAGGAYLVLLVYYYMNGGPLRGAALTIADTVFRFSFVGFMMQDTFAWGSVVGAPGVWSDVWKPVLAVLCIVTAEGVLLWLLWRRRAKK